MDAPGPELDTADTNRWPVVSVQLHLDLALDCLILSEEANLAWTTPWPVDESRGGTS